MGGAETRASPTCRNCGFSFHGFGARVTPNFCPQCGQDTLPHAPSFFEFAHEFITHYVALEGKLWKTLMLLFFKPAELSQEYRLGRKQRYISPLRLYITASFVFFLVVKVAGLGNIFSFDGDERVALRTQTKQGVVQKESTNAPATPNNKVGANFDCAIDSSFCKRLESRINSKFTGKSTNETLEFLKSSALTNVPYAMFMLLPMFALLTKILYLNRGFYYGEHVVYALHIHAFTFFAMLVFAFLPSWLGKVVSIAILGYYFVALHRYFGGRWWACLLRYGLIAFTYPLLLVCVATLFFIVIVIA